MNLFEAFRVAMTALRANKLRAVLTMLGIIIGVAAVITLLAFGNGYAQFLDSELNKLGVGTFYIFPMIDSKKADTALPPQLTAADAEAIMQPGAAPAVAMVASEFGSSATISTGTDRFVYQVLGVTPSYFAIRASELGAGRLLSAAEDQNRARVAVLGRQAAEELFGSIENAIGQRITINGVNFEVVGALADRRSALGLGSDPAETVFVPFQTAQSRLFRNQISSRVDVSQISVKARSRDQVDDAIRQVTMLLRARHRLTYQDNDFTILNLEQVSAQAAAITAGFTVFLGSIAGISLLVGGIGIMNIMLVSVTERTREIGLRKAVGARRRDILLQFLIEAIVLCLVGGTIGVGLGFALSPIGTLLLQGMGAEDGRALVTLSSIVLATVVATGVGVCFGFFPALRAARLNPIQALRYE